MVETALEKNISTPVIALSLLMRYRSLQEDTFSGKLVASLRNEFGGACCYEKLKFAAWACVGFLLKKTAITHITGIPALNQLNLTASVKFKLYTCR